MFSFAIGCNYDRAKSHQTFFRKFSVALAILSGIVGTELEFSLPIAILLTIQCNTYSWEAYSSMFIALVNSWCFPSKSPTYGGAVYSSPCNIQLIKVSKMSLDLPPTMMESWGPNVIVKYLRTYFLVFLAAERLIRVSAYDEKNSLVRWLEQLTSAFSIHSNLWY